MKEEQGYALEDIQELEGNLESALDKAIKRKSMKDIEEEFKLQRLEEKPPQALGRELKYLLIKLLLVGLIGSTLLLVVFGVTRNTELSMSPAIKHGDLVFYFRMDKQYKASDLVAFTYEGKLQIRRVVAIAGDTVDIDEQGLIINGRLQQEVEVIGETLAYTQGISFPTTLEDGQVFLLGDSRELSEDSRLYGSIEITDTLGKVMAIMRRRNL